MFKPLMVLALAQATNPASAWPTYSNVRFGYSICRPPWMKAAPEAQNGDGRIFSDRVANLRVFGSYSMNGVSAAAQADQATSYFREGRVSYRAHGSNWAVVSGRSGSRIFYVKVLTRDDRVLTMEIDYPANKNWRYGSVASRVEKCFKPLVAPF